MDDCFPPWLQRNTSRRLGPTIDEAIPYPVYQEQEAILSDDNPNSPSLNISDSYFKSIAGTIITGQVATRIIEIIPRDLYDTVVIMAFDNNPIVANKRGFPIFLSMDRPGRIVTADLIAGNPEAKLCISTAFDAADFSSYPTAIAVSQLFQIAGANAVIATNLTYPTPKTNRPFYVWFSDTTPPGNTIAVAFKITWYLQGR